MATAAEKRKADEAEAAKAKAESQNDSTKDALSAEEAQKASDERPQHIGSDSNVDQGLADDRGTISQPDLNRQGEQLTQDALGTDRIVPVGVQDAWVPAPVEPDPEAVKRAEERNAKLEAERKAYRDNQIDPVSGRLNKDVDADKKDRS